MLEKDKNGKNCKICGGVAIENFKIPSSKVTGHKIPDDPDDCIYYECTKCRFCFADILDHVNHTSVYGETYWNQYDPDWHGRIDETLRLIILSNFLLKILPWELEILDFGAGMGTFVQAAREKLGMKAWGFDIIEPKFGKEFYIKNLPKGRFDLVVACEVLEHLPFPLENTLPSIKALKDGGVFAFQTAYYDPKACGREWWYVGPANGHISLFSKNSLDIMFEKLGGKERVIWNQYPGVQAWKF